MPLLMILNLKFKGDNMTRGAIVNEFPLLFFDKNGTLYTKRIPKRKTKYTDPIAWEKEFNSLLKLLFEKTNFDFKDLEKKMALNLSSFVLTRDLTKLNLTCEQTDCNKLKRFNTTHNTLQKFCSHDCYGKHEPSKNARKATSIELYGAEHYTQTQMFKDKYKLTMNFNHGVDHNFQLLNVGLSVEENCARCNTRGNLKNPSLYFDKDYILSNFFDDDSFFKLSPFKAFFNVSQTATHAQLKRLGLTWTKYPSFSSGELWVKEVLELNGIFYKREHVFDNCVNPLTGQHLRFDFYLPEFNICIEFDGAQHQKSSRYFGGENTFIIKQIIDLINDQYCAINSIKLVRVDSKFNIREII